jgi:hypothetical protein
MVKVWAGRLPRQMMRPNSLLLPSGVARLARVALLLAPLPSLSACFGHLTPAEATMAAVEAPVLLGPVDRVGGGKPLPYEKTGEYEATSKHSFSHQESGGYSYDTQIIESETNQEAEYATRGDRYKDIRLTEVKPQAVGVIAVVKARVDGEGDVVRVKPRKGGAR